VRTAAVLCLAALLACSHAAPQPGTPPADRAQPTAANPQRAPGAAAEAQQQAHAADARSAAPAQPSSSTATSENDMLALPASDKPMVTIALRFRSGAADDPSRKAGLTALAARVMAEGGTQALDAKALQLALFPMAATIVARVDEEQTTFSATVHRDNLEKLLPILVDVVVRPRWDAREFARLRDAQVLDVEKRLRQGDDENLGKEALSETMYRGHPYGRLIAGHVGDLRSITLDELRAHAGKVFTSDRLTIGVAGGYPQNLPPRVSSGVAQLPRGGGEAADVPQQKPHGPRYLLVEKPADSTAISCGMPFSLSRKDRDWPAMSVARSAFGEHRQFNGRLMQRLRELRGLNYGDYAYIEHFEQQGGDAATAQLGRTRHQQGFTIWLRPVQNENRLFALRAALYELQRTMRDEPFGDAEVQQTKDFLDGYLLLFDQTDARKLGYAMDDDFLEMRDFLRNWRGALRDVTPAQVNAAWRKWIKPDALQCVLVGPGMTEVKKALLSDAETPMHYQKDAQGNVPQKPAELLESDRAVNQTAFGAKGDGDVQIVPVEKMFE
jgi:zinc protease